MSVVNSAGETTFSFRSEESSEIHGGVPTRARRATGCGTCCCVPRLATSFDLTETQTLRRSARRPRSVRTTPGPTRRRRSSAPTCTGNGSPLAAQQGFPFVSFQAEALLRRYEAAERVASTTRSRRSRRRRCATGAPTRRCCGASSRASWPDCAASVVQRQTHASFARRLASDRYRISPNLTWYPTEFSKLRLQYNYDDRKGIGRDHSLWLQFEFLLGAHAAHKF